MCIQKLLVTLYLQCTVVSNPIHFVIFFLKIPKDSRVFQKLVTILYVVGTRKGNYLFVCRRYF